jgi:hypothetical protein
LEEISEFESKEYGLERSLENMEKDWQPLVFEVINFFLSTFTKTRSNSITNA